MATLPTPPIPTKQPYPWLHFVAGGKALLGGVCGAIVTSPFDVVKTRLQSDLFCQKHAAVNIMGSGGSMVIPAPHPTNLLYNFVETGYIIRHIYREESFRALFKGLGSSLVGVVPARSINFFTYGNANASSPTNSTMGKRTLMYVHLTAAAFAGIVTHRYQPYLGGEDPATARPGP